MVSCCVTRRCDGMGPDAVGCWSWELEDAEGATCLRLYDSWRWLSCGRMRLPEPVSWERAGGGGGGVPALAAALPPAPDGSMGWFSVTETGLFLKETKKSELFRK